uniref:Uncharacterized protein n=1 Tax=Podospora anserina (strain S / ATCC MYA-4624 / DSM 980 / FGSC 10383) TaxID=515849 RepID=A0A090CX89_PODAN|nr:Putative protein of unknown function [Podospora anserina S mat+]
MPVTIYPSSHPPEPARLHQTYTRVTSPEQLLSSITSHETNTTSRSSPPRTRPIIQSSFSESPSTSPTILYAAKNGLVYSLIEAYSNHHNLLLRPDDIWLAILSQLSVYINANATLLQHLFIPSSRKQSSPAQKQDLYIPVDLSPTLNHGSLAQQMASTLLPSSLTNPDIAHKFFLPSFTTTTETDEIAASILLMGSMQKYFVYSWGTRCGIPSITLLGDQTDWEKILHRCEEFLASGRFGQGARDWWRGGLGYVLSNFVRSLRDPGGKETKTFWQRVLDRHEPNGSGKTTFTGWVVNGFCWWDEEGRHDLGRVRGGMTRGEMPMGFGRCPVSLWDNGVEVKTEMIAGMVGVRVGRMGDVLRRVEEDEWPGGRPEEGGRMQPRAVGGVTEKIDTLRPEVGWFMYSV